MGFKLTVDEIENVGHSSGLPKINENFEELADEFDKVLYRDGSLAVTDDLDMDSNRLLNLPAPLTAGEPARLGDLLQLTPADTIAVLNTKADQADFLDLVDEVAEKVSKSEFRVNVLDYMTTPVATAVKARTQATSVITEINAAAAVAVALSLPLHFPAGTYPFLTWSPPGGLRVTTDGKETVFKQLDTNGSSVRLIVIEQDGIYLWPDGAATVDGSMDTIPGNATEQNHGVFVDPADGVTIYSGATGDIHGRNMGGDVICTYCSDTGYLEHFRFGDIYGFNTYRVIAGLTAGRTLVVGDIIDQGEAAGEGSGIGTVFVELDATNNSPIEYLNIGHVRGRLGNVVGQPGGPRVGYVRIESMDFDPTRPMSSPEYDVIGINKTSQPALFYTGFQYREVGTIYVGAAKFANCEYSAIKDTGESGSDWTDRVEFGTMELVDNGSAASAREIIVQKTRVFKIGHLKATEKAENYYALFVAGQPGASIQVDSLESVGRVATSEADIRIKDGTVDSNNEHLFYYTNGKIDLDNVTVTGTAVSLFNGCTKIPTLKNCTIDTPTSVRGAGDPVPNLRLTNTTIGTTTYRDRLYVAPVSTIADPAGGATVDTESRTAIAAIIDALQSEGIVA